MADFHKAGIYGSGRAWANVWGLFRGTTSRPGRGNSLSVCCVLLCNTCLLLLYIIGCESCTLADFHKAGIYLWKWAGLG